MKGITAGAGLLALQGSTANAFLKGARPNSDDVSLAKSAKTPSNIAFIGARRPRADMQSEPEDGPGRFELSESSKPSMRMGFIGRPVMNYVRDVANQSAGDLYRAGATLNSLAYRTTVDVLGAPLEALRARQSKCSGDAPTTLDKMKVILELGVGPLAMFATTIASVSALLDNSVIVGKFLIPIEMARVAHSRLQNRTDIVE